MTIISLVAVFSLLLTFSSASSMCTPATAEEYFFRDFVNPDEDTGTVGEQRPFNTALIRAHCAFDALVNEQTVEYIASLTDDDQPTDEGFIARLRQLLARALCRNHR